MADSEATWRLAPVRSCHHPSREVQLKGATEGEVKNSEPSKIPWVPPISQMQLKKTAGQPLTLKKKKKKSRVLPFADVHGVNTLNWPIFSDLRSHWVQGWDERHNCTPL